MKDISMMVEIKRLRERCYCALIVCFMLSGCVGPGVVRDLPPLAGTDLYVRAPAKQVFERLPEAVRLAGMDWERVDKEGPPKWQAVALVGISMGTDGQWTRITVEDVAPDLSHLTAVSRQRGAGVEASLDTPPRNILLHTLLLNNPAITTSSLKPIRRPDKKMDVVRFQNISQAAMAPRSKPVWSHESIGSNAAFLASIEGRGLLIAYTTMKRVGVNMFSVTPCVTCIALHEFGTGKLIWKREINLGSSVSLVAVQPGLVLLTSDSLHSFDLSTGADLWSLKYNVAASAVDGETKSVVLWTREKLDTETQDKKKGKKKQQEKIEQKESLIAVGLGDGKVRWNTRIPDSLAAGKRDFFIEGKRVFVIGQGAAVYSLDTGNRGAQDLAALTTPIKHLALQDALIIGDKTGMLTCVRADGSVLWKTDLAGPVDYLSSNNDDLLVSSSTGSMMDLRLISAKTGKQLWSRRDDLFAGNPVFSARILAYSTKEKVVILDSASGKETGTALRSDAMRQARLPDRLLVYDDQVTAVGETGIMAVSTGGKRKPGEVLWALNVRGTDLSNLAARQDQSRRAEYNSGGWPENEAEAGFERAEKIMADSKAFSEFQYNMVRMAEQQAARNKEEMKRSLQTGSQSVQQMRSNIAIDKAQSQMQFSTAMLGALISMYDAVDAQRAIATAELERSQNMRCEAAIRRASELWALSLQGGYFVRPIGWEFGEGAVVVDLHTGHWTEIITGPGEPLLHDFHIQYPAATLSPDGRHLFTLAHRDGPGVSEHPSFVAAERSAAAFALPDRTLWYPPQEYPQKSLAPKPIVEMVVTSKL